MKENSSPGISIIVPALNEQEHIGLLVSKIKQHSSAAIVKEIIIVDGGSADHTANIAINQGVRVLRSKKGRARQMNLGARHAQGAIFYFLHADTLPPKNFDQHILAAVESGYNAGCFRMKFDRDTIFLNIFSWFTRVNHKICRGGDQSLFITKELFQKMGGFDEKYLIYEDNEFIGRLYAQTSFKILPQYVRTSARKYREKGTLRLQYHFGMIHLKKYLGAGPEQLYDYYRRKIIG